MLVGRRWNWRVNCQSLSDLSRQPGGGMMSGISTDARVAFWVIAAIAGALFAIFGNVLAKNIVYYFSKKGAVPSARPAHIWMIFYISLFTSIIFGAFAAFAPSTTLETTDKEEYIGRVIDVHTQQVIVGAKISLDLEGVPPFVYSDSEGIYRFEVSIASKISGQIRVEAPGYEVYTRNISISPENNALEDIRLTPQGATPVPSQTSVPTATANPTLIALFSQATTPNPKFIPQSRVIAGIEQVWVPEGHFVAGDISGFGYPDESPFHLVYTNGFWIDRNLVTNSEYASCPNSICTPPQKVISHVRPNGYYGIPTFENYPMIQVIWQQASDFCSWRNGRLPTEAEFEKAAGWDPITGLTFLYPWGDLAPTEELANFDGIDRDTTPIGSYPQGMSPVGAYDMAGNVWQWTSDWHSETYYSDNQEWNNPTGPADGKYKVIRGGSWFSKEIAWLRVSNRGKGIPDKVANEIGFRCVYEE